jgi:hypothetical protein
MTTVIRKVYTFLLLLFLAMLATINITAFLTDFNKKQLINLFHVRQRLWAVVGLYEHIFFESGLVLSDTEQSVINGAIKQASEATGIDEMLITLMVEPSKRFVIHENGAVGLMRVRSQMVEKGTTIDLFKLEDNILAGANYLKTLKTEETKNALIQYYKPVSKTLFKGEILRMQKKALDIYWDYNAIRNKPTTN